MKRCCCRRIQGIAVCTVFVLLLAMVSVASAAVELTMYTWYSKGTAMGEAMRTALDGFEKENPGIKVTLQEVANNVLAEKLLVAYTGGAPPELAMISSAWAFDIVDSGMLVPLDGLIQRSSIINRNDYGKGVWDALMFNGVTYALPFTGAPSYDTWYNMNMFDNAGLDRNNPPIKWDTFAQAAKRLTRDTNGDGVPDQYGLTQASYIPLLFANGGDYITPDGRKLLWNSKAGLEALEFVAELYQTLRVVAPTAGRKVFMDQTAAMHPEGPYVMGEIRRDANFDAGYAVPPHKIDVPRGYGAINAVGVVRTTPEKEAAAWKVAEYLMRPDVQAKWVIATGFPPFSGATVKQKAFQEVARQEPVFMTAYTSVQYMVLPALHPQAAAVQRILFQVAQNPVRAGTVAPKVALDNATSQAQAILDEYWAKKDKK